MKEDKRQVTSSYLTLAYIMASNHDNDNNLLDLIVALKRIKLLNLGPEHEIERL